MSLTGFFDNFDFSSYDDSYNDILPESSFEDFTSYNDILPESSFQDFTYYNDIPTESSFYNFDPQGGGAVTGYRGTADPRTLVEEGETLSTEEFARQYYDDRSYAQIIKEGLFETLGIGKETAKAIGAFAKAANKGGGKQGQAQGRGRVGPGLPSSARAPTTPAGRTSKARQATSGERAVQAAIQQSQRATSAARAIANQMARAGTVTSTNDLADMISGADKPMGTRQKLPGSNLRQLAIPRTQMA